LRVGRVYTNRSKILQKATNPEFRKKSNELKNWEFGKAGGLKDADVRLSQKPIFEFICVYKGLREKIGSFNE